LRGHLWRVGVCLPIQRGSAVLSEPQNPNPRFVNSEPHSC
jgi:hypothetical protein